MDGIIELMQRFGYLGIALIVALENVFPPIPSEIVLPFAGFMTTQGPLSIVGVIIASTIGSMIGALILYLIGRLFGRDRIYMIVRLYGRWLGVNEEQVTRAEQWFQRSGPMTVFVCRLVPIIRSLISIPAGLVGMNLPLFLLCTVVGTLLWNTLLVSLGAALGTAWPVVVVWVDVYKNFVIVVGIAAVVLFFWYNYRKVTRH